MFQQGMEGKCPKTSVSFTSTRSVKFCMCIFQRLQIALALRARAILLVFEKFTRADLSQIALEIM